MMFCLKTGGPLPLMLTPLAPLLTGLAPPLVITVVPGSLGWVGRTAGPGLMCSSTIWISESTRLMVMLLGRLISGSAAALLIDIPCKYNTDQSQSGGSRGRIKMDLYSWDLNILLAPWSMP